jgi:hypothetical protein
MTNYQTALERMPDLFTSHDYLAELREIGVPENVIEDGEHLKFLEKNCHQLTKKTWKKKPFVEKNGQMILPIIDDSDLDKTEEFLIKKYIAYLKARGYKILKPEFVEV